MPITIVEFYLQKKIKYLKEAEPPCLRSREFRKREKRSSYLRSQERWHESKREEQGETPPERRKPKEKGSEGKKLYGLKKGASPGGQRGYWEKDANRTERTLSF